MEEGKKALKEKLESIKGKIESIQDSNKLNELNSKVNSSKAEFENRYNQFKELARFKKEDKKEKYEHLKSQIKEKYAFYKEMKHNKNYYLRQTTNFTFLGFIMTSSYLFYKGPIKGKYRIGAKWCFILPFVVFSTIHLQVQEYTRKQYYSKIKQELLKYDKNEENK